MYFFWFVFCIFFLLIPGSKESLSLISGANDDFCITTDLSAMYYTTSSGNARTEDIQFLPPPNYFCDFETAKCIETFKRDPWTLAYSLSHEETPILDLRWERLNVQELPFKKNGNLEFLTLFQLYDLKYFKLPISLLAEEVHLLLCDKEDVPNANCYWFALQGWDHKYSAMRRCKSGEIRGLYPSGDCYPRKEEKRHPEDFPLFLSKEKWAHIIIERNKNNLYLKTYNDGKEETVIHYSENDEMFQLKYLIGHRKDAKAYCKIHENFQEVECTKTSDLKPYHLTNDMTTVIFSCMNPYSRFEYHYMRSVAASEVIFESWFSRINDGFCLSIFLRTCQDCSILISFLNETSSVMLEKPIPPTNDIWTEHKIILNNSTSKFMKVQLKTILYDGLSPTGNEYWSFDNFRQCLTEEYRITPQNSKQKLSECRLLTNNQEVKLTEATRYKPDDSCSTLSSIGASCISCNVLEKRNKKSCEKLKICENIKGSNICYCSPGYTGSDCVEECPYGSFGYLCREQCGFCVGKCDVLDGSCNCHYLFEGPTCKMPKEDQYLAKAPKVISSTVKSCEIQWNSEDFIGKTAPKYYLLQYTDFSTHPISWLDYGEIGKIEDTEKGSVGKLMRSRKYGIRVLISDKKRNIKKLQHTNLPFTICNTSCNGWNVNEINVETTSESVHISLRLSEDKCDISLYEWSLENHHGETIINGSASLEVNISKLTPFQDYRIVFFSSSDKISKDFKTLEGVPSKVKNIELEESTASYMKIKWDVPEDPKGDIQMYFVKYQKVRRISCKSKGWFPSFEANTTVNIIELNNLEPYSEYSITVNAINRLKIGDATSAYFHTQGLDYFKNEENLKAVNIWMETLERGASITFQNILCENLQGPLNFSATFQCISEWCLKTEERSEILQSFQGTLYLKGLQPYCEYKCDISFCRYGNCNLLENRTFETKASLPNELKEVIVMSTGDAFIWIRWQPPYPPTGKTQIYKITTICVDCHLNHENTYYPVLKKCNIWPEYYCHKISQYVYYKYHTSLRIDAANGENYKYKQIAYVPNILVEETSSEKPYNVSVTMNLDNTMEIFWNHPNRTNGILDHFHIRVINDNESFNVTYKPSKWRLTYNLSVTKSVPTATDLSIIIVAVNNKYLGEPAQVDVSSYPPSPDLADSQINVENYTETTISFSLNTNQVQYLSPNVKRLLLVLINDHSSETKDSNLEVLEKIMNFTFEKESLFRVVTEQDLGKLSSNSLSFTIGNGDVSTGSSIFETNIINKPLQEAHYYIILVVLLNEYKGKYRYVFYNTTTLTKGDPKMTTSPPPKFPDKEAKEQADNSSGGGAAYALLLLLLLIPIIIGIILKRKNIVLIRPTMSLEKIMDASNSQNSHQAKDNEETIPLDIKETVVLPQKPIMKVKPKLSLRKSTGPPNPPTDLYSKPVKMADFEEYVKTSIESGELERQHALFPRGQTQPWKYGSTKVNKPKNRYNNLVAYDHSRVILTKIEGDEYSDYINANYIHGYNMERAYIATQGPKATTLTDFWRMIWQENVKHIVMLANIYEGGKKKVEQYWPNINEELTFQDIVVQYHSMELFANFEYRIFHVTRGAENREIEQLHFTTWPDHGVPLYPQSLVPFIRKLLKVPLSSTSPVVVHCSAGVGRTGTILLADISLRMAAKQGIVDMLNNLQKLREQRPNMVDNVEQYKLAHLVVLECLMGLRTSVSCDENMDKNVQKLIRDGDYKIQMNYLKETEWQDQAMKSVADFSEDLPSYPEKNRIPEVIPENQGRIFLSRYPHDDEASSYINAVEVDAFRCPGRFFVTQQPMPNTIGDFWRLVTERKISVIISLNEVDLREKTCCKFWPTADETELQPVDFISVKFNKVTELEYYDIYSLHVWMKNKRQKEKLDVEVVSLKRWPAKSTLPHSCEEFLSFYEEADAISRRSTNVIVTCFDGFTASGVYVALSFMIEQMKLEHECDVCLAVRTIRHNRKQFVSDESQFLFLYECAVKFINGFQSYANFQNQ